MCRSGFYRLCLLICTPIIKAIQRVLCPPRWRMATVATCHAFPCKLSILQTAKRVTVAGMVQPVGRRPAIRENYDPDTMWKVLRDVHQGIRDIMLGPINLSKPTSLGGYYDALLQYEKALRSEAHTAEWMISKRDEWLAEVKNTSKYSQGHFATCLCALEGDIRQEAQDPLWLMLHRSSWKRACDNLGAQNLNISKQ